MWPSTDVDRRKVILYWKDVSLEKQHGPDFQFSVNDSRWTSRQFKDVENVSLNDEVFKLSSFNKVFCLLTIQSYFLIICIEGWEVKIKF